jgi:selenide,water dikinase
LISLGGKSAMAEKYGLTVSGPLLWRWKDRIDRAFMDRLSDVPVMGQAALRGEVALGVREALEAKPLCGGCGAKGGGAVLGDALAELPGARGDVVAGAGDDAAVLKTGAGFQVISTDHLRAFVADPCQMARIAAVHALGDVWAMGAVPQVMLSQVVVPQMSAVLQARTLGEITRAVQGVAEGAGAQVVGGHTTMGAELTIGFTVTGVCSEMPITTAGARAGDVLILTRPVGSGVIMAALMQGVADGRDVAAALEMMQQPQHREAEVLKAAHAMTDVTGFGLAGHVGEMARASGLDAVLWREAIPVYAGARALSEAGVASTLMPVNRGDARVQGVEDALIYDPQTSGGLLAAVGADRVDEVLAALEAAGCKGYRIGRFDAGSGAVTLK